MTSSETSFGKDTTDDANQREPQEYCQDNSNSLMRAVTQYTEYSVSHPNEESVERLERERDEEMAKEQQGPVKAGFWSNQFSQHRGKFLKQYAAIIVILWMFILSVFSIYWGAMYQRGSRLVNLKILLIVEEGASIDNSDYPVSQALLQVAESPAVKPLLGWTRHAHADEDWVINEVWKQKYWGALYVTSNNVSQQLVQALQNGQDLNTSMLVKGYYETGRDPNGVNSFVEPGMLKFGAAFTDIMQQEVYPRLLSQLSSEQFTSLQNITTLSHVPDITMIDGIPVSDYTVMAPLQVGLIYIIIVTFFQVMWFQKINQQAAETLKPGSYIIYRMVSAQVNFLLISLGYSCVNAAFQIKLNNAWKGGFGVHWMISYLTMSAVGGANENIALLCFAVLPPLMGFWLVFFVVCNISATFSPIEVCPEFYRFTYAMPIKNSYELMKVLLFDTYRGNLGRNFGILVAWIALNNILLPFCLFFFSWYMKRKLTQTAQKSR
ncbi:hypothetical protein KL906_002617 [Ogataea polymorpha]|uniref:DUF3533 domain-containing protein n=1 Tax=Ogataea polymorpha TaxID=460523 RepID=A0A9P8PT12_9ASCO|nr:hypothetical protein KL906_002617 [Ogataea polymorpha]KAG7916146.1 hypothetical protein KL927_003611 [Ogataea polymorpha]KAH3677798.1 hypothetical protein OGATHE_000452 [Ogataea polymorpha]